MKLLPPRIFQMSLLAIPGIHFLVPVWFIYNSPIRFVGLIPILIGSYLNLHTDWLIKKHETTVKPYEKPSSLIQEGPFRYSRNPMYLGMVLFVLGCSLLSGSILTFIVPVALAFVLHFYYIVKEEKLLEKSIGAEYLNYKRKVRSWI